MIISNRALKIAGEAIEGLLLAYNTIHSLLDKAPAGLKEKLPMFLGLSREDERRWADIWTYLDENERKNITDFLESLEKYERNSFRYVLIDMPKHEVKSTTTPAGKADGKEKDKKPTPVTTTESRTRAAEFLRNLSKTIDASGLPEAKRQCLAGNIIDADAMSAKIAKKWHDSLEWLTSHEHEIVGFAKESCTSLNAQCGTWTTQINARVNTMPKHNGHLEGIFGHTIGGFIKKMF